MSSSERSLPMTPIPPLAVAVWCDETQLWVRLRDGRQLSVPLNFFPRLERASAAERERVLISGAGRGLHWEELDEDISVAGLLAGIGDRTREREHHEQESED